MHHPGLLQSGSTVQPELQKWSLPCCVQAVQNFEPPGGLCQLLLLLGRSIDQRYLQLIELSSTVTALPLSEKDSAIFVAVVPRICFHNTVST